MDSHVEENILGHGVAQYDTIEWKKLRMLNVLYLTMFLWVEEWIVKFLMNTTN